MTTARGIHSCCPEAPSTINVTQNIIQLDGETTIHVADLFVGSQVSSGVLTLSKTPYSAASVHLALNSGVQRLGIDYQVSGNRIIFLCPIAASDLIDVKYLTVGAGLTTVVGSGLAVGTVVGYGSAGVAPDGWLMLNGTTKVYQSAYAALYSFLASNLHLTDGTGVQTDGSGNYYVLKSVATSYYDGATLVTGNTIIKT